jgi:transcriptional regulator with XRE-family HTH domain
MNMKTKHEDFEVCIPDLAGTGIAERLTVQIPLEWDEEVKQWLIGPEANRIIEDTKARHMGLLLPAQFKELRERYGYTQKQMGELFQVGEKSWTRWESGKHRPSRSNNLPIRALYDGEISINYLLKRAGKPPREESEWVSPAFVSAFLAHSAKHQDVAFFPGSGSPVTVQSKPSSGQFNYIAQLVKLVKQQPGQAEQLLNPKAASWHGRLGTSAPTHTYPQPRLTPTEA